jgi:glycosyltransferase involved in cell wall biosynthesis
MAESLRICIATHHFPPKYFAGAEQYAYRLARHLIHMGHQVEVVTIEAIDQGKLEPDCRTDIFDGITVHRLSFNILQVNRSFPLLYRNPYLGEWFRHYFSDYKPDLLHVNSGYLLGGTVIEAARAAQISVALTLHEYWFLCPLHTLLRTSGRVCDKPVPAVQCKWCLMSKKRRFRILDHRFQGRVGDTFVKISSNPLFKNLINRDLEINDINERRKYLRKIFEQVDLVISPSQFLVDKMNAYGFNHPNMIQLPYGIDLTPQIIERRKREPGTLRLGYLGRVSPEKGIDVVVRAMKLISDPRISFDIYGQINLDGVYEQSLIAMVKKDARIHLKGRYKQSELPDVLHSLDATVVPSRWYENRPGTILEAFAYGKPVIASRLGGMIEMIAHNEDGLLFTPNDAEDLALQLRRLMNEPDLLNCLERGIQPIPQAKEEIEQIEAKYHQIVKNHSGISV